MTEREERIDAITAEFRFDIALLADRVVGALDWAQSQPQTASLPVGIFGASTGAAAALIDTLLKAAETAGTRPRFVDISADFRFATAAAYEAVYKHAHGAPQRLGGPRPLWCAAVAVCRRV